MYPDAETYEMISVATIARLARTTSEQAELWTQDPSFPHPIARLHTGNLYDRMAVHRWLLEHGHEGLEIPPAP